MKYLQLKKLSNSIIVYLERQEVLIVEERDQGGEFQMKITVET